MNPLLEIFILAAIGSVAGVIGSVVFLANKKAAKFFCKYAVPFAAGILLTVSLIDLLPEAVEKIGSTAFFVTLAAFLASFFLEEFFVQLHHHENDDHGQKNASVSLVLLGDTIHNFIDGVAIAAAYFVNPMLGLLVAFSTFLHETPHEIADFGVLLSAGWSKTRAFWANLFSALATFPGVLVVYFFASGYESTIGMLLAVSAGIFLYLATTDFLPEIGEEKNSSSRRLKLIALLFGLLIMLVTSSMLSF